jgi:6-phosphogluconolactonase
VSHAVDVHRHADATELAAALAQRLAGELTAAVVARGTASLVVSGGRTPVALFRCLRQLPIDWARISLTLADERWVAPADPASNERLLREELLQDRAAAARFIPLKNPAATAAAGAVPAWQALQAIVRPFDVVLLGMGDDGHTASLFPQSPGLAAALDPQAAPACVAMTAPGAPTQRLSLNLAALLQTRSLFLHFSGEAKWQVWQAAADLPVGLTLSRSATRPQLYWSP